MQYSRHYEVGRDFIGVGRVWSLPEAAVQSPVSTSHECGMLHGYGCDRLVYTTSQVRINTSQKHEYMNLFSPFQENLSSRFPNQFSQTHSVFTCRDNLESCDLGIKTGYYFLGSEQQMRLSDGTDAFVVCSGLKEGFLIVLNTQNSTQKHIDRLNTSESNALLCMSIYE